MRTWGSMKGVELPTICRTRATSTSSWRMIPLISLSSWKTIRTSQWQWRKFNAARFVSRFKHVWSVCMYACSKKIINSDVGRALLGSSWMTLSFLKILIFDIGLPLGDTATDMLQWFSFIIDYSTFTLRRSTMKYGIAIILASWLPVMIATTHLGVPGLLACPQPVKAGCS